MKKIGFIGVICLLVLGILASAGWAMIAGEQSITGRAVIAPVRPMQLAPKVVPLQEPAPNCSAIMVAGQKHEVGQVEITYGQDTLTGECWLDVKYVIDVPGYALKDIHFEVADGPSSCYGIPQTNGNPVPGRFTYKKEFGYPYGETEWGFKYPVPCNQEPPFVIAAHATVTPTISDLTWFSGGDDQATIIVKYPVAGGPSYFQVIVSDAGNLNGTYNGWCVDTDRVIYQNTPYCAEIVSSYAPATALEGLVEYPENLDLVNWIINQNIVGQTSPGGYGIYTYGDVQRAIWELIDDTPSTSGLGAWDQNRVNEIKAAAQTYGEGFLPGCGQKLAVLFKPVNCSTGADMQVVIAQVIITEVMRPCRDASQTAWGAMKCEETGAYQCRFPGKNWALFFTCPNIDPCDVRNCPTCTLP